MQRSHYCNLIPTDHHPTAETRCAEQNLIGQSFTFNGWVKKVRRHGALSFINLRDRYGEIQLTIDTEQTPDLKDLVDSLRLEFCIAAQGVLQLRPKEMQNLSMKTGQVELCVTTLEILNSCEILPFMLQKEQSGESDGSEALRLKYRYLDLRSAGMQSRMWLRHQIRQEIHSYLGQQNFWEMETPTLIRSMPEGARDYLVPSRIHPGTFYALPQSPQLYKQLLMVGGLDSYYQLARCYRDEDPRGDRQPEFTQLDLEMSFVQVKDIQQLMEGLLAKIWHKILGQELKLPFAILSYEQAMDSYGSDKPDLRNPLQLQDFATFASKSDFAVFRQCLVSNEINGTQSHTLNFIQSGSVKVLIVPQGTGYCSRKIIDELETEAQKYGAKGLPWMRVGVNNFEGGIAKFFQGQFGAIVEHFSLKSGDMLFFSADRWDIACNALGSVRKKLGEEQNLIDKKIFAFAWVMDFPLFLPKGQDGWVSAHHMFCMPHAEYLDTMAQNPGAVRGHIYDLILNGYELGSGSIRVHRADIQVKIFDIVGYSQKMAEERFGFMLEALRYGAPPHGGIALGLDRLAMIMAGKESIKEVIAFPKNNLGQSLLDLSPGAVTSEQLSELQLTQLLKQKIKAN